MGAIVPALPWIIKGGAAIGGALLGRKAQKSAMQRSPEELLALQGGQQAAQGLTQTGQSLLQSGMNAQQPAMNYFQTLLRGSRGAMSQAVAAPTAALTDVYRGAERGLERSGIQGAARDVASADLNRQRASQISSLITGVQPGAAQALAGMGSGLVGQGVGAQSAGAGIYGNLLNAGTANRVYGRQQGAEFGSSMGGLIFDILNGSLGKLGQKKPLPSQQTVPPSTIWMPPTGGGL